MKMNQIASTITDIPTNFGFIQTPLVTREDRTFVLRSQEAVSKDSIEFMGALKEYSNKVSVLESDVDQGWAWAKESKGLIDRMTEIGQAVVESDVILIKQVCTLVLKELNRREMETLRAKHQFEYITSAYSV